jgi:amino-acid N-acetyltransferase
MVSMPAFTFRRAHEGDGPLVADLLRRARLPIDGVADHLPRFVLAFLDGALVGCAGLEVYGAPALLRSVAVAEEQRGTGLGQALVHRILDQARADGVREVFLLTETAPAFFPKFGFVPITRAEVPDAVKASVEFTGACCASAAVMRLPLGR